MFRQSLLPRACFGVVLGLAAVAPTAPARSQDRLTLERLDRLERDLNMLQRQVYRGAPAPMLSGDPGGAASGEVRMDRLEQQMRELTGRVEEFVNQIDQLRQRVEQINGDVETRVGQTPSKSGSFAAAAPAPRPPRGNSVSLPTPAPPPGGVPGAPPPDPGAPPSGPTPIFNTLTPPGAPPASPPDLVGADVPRPPTERMLPSGSASEQYNYAFGLLKQADYPAAETALKSFVEQHPKDPMAGNAQYWLGETYYTRGRFIEAASAFAEGYKRYPKGSKAPDGLLKLGMSLARANQNQNACVALAQLDHDFPSAGAAIKDRAGAEKKRLGC